MKQVIQDFKTGDLYVGEVPMPSVAEGFVLVRNQYSLISAGTERTTVSTGKASLIGKAKQRPDLVKQVLETYKKEGFSETLKRVRTKLETLKELGYSSAGTVIMSMDKNGAFKPGDRVACGGGGYASHSEIVSVPQNLVVKLPDSLSLDCAAFTTLGAIAMQGVRQANPHLGDYVCVIGLGLLGQITAQILRANGCQVFGIDKSQTMVDMSKIACHRAMTRNNPILDSELDAFTEGHGFDSIIITAAAPSNDPIVLATSALRKKGAIVVVGAVPMDIPREPHFYQKELELKISCSYGPGRYDHSYEEEGHDYPYGYVRWTENRNMAAFVRLMANKSIDVKPLITHVFDVNEAEKAYDVVTGKTREHHTAILLKYSEAEEKKPLRHDQVTFQNEQAVRVGFIGAGSFAQKYLIPYAGTNCQLQTVVTSRGITAKSVGEKFKFQRFSANVQDVFSDKSINAVFIATRHNTHGELVKKALESEKNVFVEKPLTIDREDLATIAHLARKHNACRLMVGFNRRFSPLAKQAREVFGGLSEPIVINYRINAGFIPNDHWTQTQEGGGRILGEVCHFVDFMQFIAGDHPVQVFADCVTGPNTKMRNHDNTAITIRFRNGSVGTITYLACGDKSLSKEYIEIFGGGKSFIIHDFSMGELYSNGKRGTFKNPGKGHKEEVELFIKTVHGGLSSPLSLDSILYTTATTFGILDSLRTGMPQTISAV